MQPLKITQAALGTSWLGLSSAAQQHSGASKVAAAAAAFMISCRIDSKPLWLTCLAGCRFGARVYPDLDLAVPACKYCFHRSARYAYESYDSQATELSEPSGA